MSMLLLMKKITCQLIAKEEVGNLTLTEVKGTLLEDLSKLIPVDYRFLKPVSENFKTPLAGKQEKLVTLQKMSRRKQQIIFPSSADY